VCGDGNINFLQSSTNERELRSLLLRYNLKHVVNVPTQITESTATVFDVVIINERKLIDSIIVTDLGLSGHYAQIL
jgi:hypothetical protein